MSTKTIEKTEGLWPTMINVTDVTTNQKEWGGRTISTLGCTLPCVNICESPKEYIIELAVPGMRKEDFRIEHSNHILNVWCEIDPKKVTKGTEVNYTCKEFSYNSFYRSFTLPVTANNEEIHATYVDGILRISVNKKTVTAPKSYKAISIK